MPQRIDLEEAQILLEALKEAFCTLSEFCKCIPVRGMYCEFCTEGNKILAIIAKVEKTYEPKTDEPNGGSEAGADNVSSVPGDVPKAGG
jgi:hypothetical protein